MRGAVEAVEAVYREQSDENVWAREVVDAASKLFRDAESLHFVLIEHSADGADGALRLGVGGFALWPFDAARVVGQLTPDSLRSLYYPPRMVTPLATILRGMAPDARGGFREYIGRYGMLDAIGITVHPAPGVVGVLFGGYKRAAALDTPRRRLLTNVGLHLETGLRLRLRPESLRAVLTPAGKVEHVAESTPGDPLDTAALARRVTEIERARRGKDVEMWPALTSGQLSLVERDDGGRRYYLAVDNAPTSQKLRALTGDEVNAIDYATRGFTMKEIAYALGVSQAAASDRLGRAATKIGLSTTLDLVRVAAMFARDPRARFTDTALSTAEREVLALVEQGLSNAQIAQLRNRSVRTIANQVAALLRKTGRGSRRTLVAGR